MIAYNWFDCDKQPQPQIVNVFAGCVVPPAGGALMNLSTLNLLPFIEWVAASPLSKAISDVDVGVRGRSSRSTCWRCR